MTTLTMSKNNRTHNNQKRHMNVLKNDVRLWIMQHITAVSTTILLVVANIAHWIFIASNHLVTRGASASIAQLLTKPRPKLGKTPFFGHANVTTLLSKLLQTLVMVDTLPALLVNALLVIIIISVAETKLPKLHLIIISLVSTIIGSILGLLVIGGLSSIINNLHWITKLPIRLSPLTLCVGVFMAAACFESTIWHRRMLVIGYATTAAILLYSGNPGDYCTMIAATSGHVIGSILSSQRSAWRLANWSHSTSYEIRQLFAMIQIVMAAGPILAITSQSHAGILTLFGILLSPQNGHQSLLEQCFSNHSATSCLLHAGLQHAAFTGMWIRSILAIVTMLLLAWGLLRARRSAAISVMLLHGTIALFASIYFAILPLLASLQHNHYYHSASAIAFMLTAIPSLLFACLIAINLRHFPVRTEAKRLKIGVCCFIATLCGTACAYVTFGLIMPQSYRPRANIAYLLRDLPGLWLPMGLGSKTHTMLTPRSALASLASHSVGIIVWIVLFIICTLWFRNIASTNTQHRSIANNLVHLGGESMTFMTTWDDNQYWLSPTQCSAIAYRIKYGMALTLTGPFGDEREYEQDLRDFTDFCENNSWSPAFYAVHESQRLQLEQLGFHSIQVGTEMRIDPAQWQTRGKKWQDIRTAINKAKREGIHDVLTTYREAPWIVQQQINEISEEWAELKSLPEMKFTLGGLKELQDPRVLLLYAIDEQQRVLGVTSWMPTYRNNRIIGWTLDFMRHRTDSPNGIMELLIARMAERLRDYGIEHPEYAVSFMSLSAAPLAGISEVPSYDDNISQNMLNHLLDMMSDILEPAYGFKSLYFFKKKFQPISEPIYVCYLDSAKLAQISLAVTRSYLPDANVKQLVDMVKILRTKNDHTHKQ